MTSATSHIGHWHLWVTLLVTHMCPLDYHAVEFNWDRKHEITCHTRGIHAPKDLKCCELKRKTSSGHSGALTRPSVPLDHLGKISLNICFGSAGTSQLRPGTPRRVTSSSAAPRGFYTNHVYCLGGNGAVEVHLGAGKFPFDSRSRDLWYTSFTQEVEQFSHPYNVVKVSEHTVRETRGSRTDWFGSLQHDHLQDFTCMERRYR